jgi:hypothetical protein
MAQDESAVTESSAGCESAFDKMRVAGRREFTGTRDAAL